MNSHWVSRTRIGSHEFGLGRMTWIGSHELGSRLMNTHWVSRPQIGSHELGSGLMNSDTAGGSHALGGGRTAHRDLEPSDSKVPLQNQLQARKHQANHILA
jgi:hypothetical protein